MFFAALLAITPTISGSYEAVTVATMLRDLSTKVGAPLAAEGRLAKEIVAARFAAVEPDRLIADLAQGLSATWTTQNGGRLLARTADQSKALRDAANAHRAKRFAENVRIAKEVTKALPPFDARSYVESLRSASENYKPADPASMTALQQMREFSPWIRLEKRLRAALDERELSTLLPGRRIVYATGANRWQRPLNKAMSTALADYLRERTALQAERDRVGLDLRGNDHVGPDVNAGPGVRLRIAVKPLSDGYTTRFALRLYDGSGTTIANNGVANLDGPSTWTGPHKPETDDPELPADPSLVPWSFQIQEKDRDPKVLAKMRQPDLVDPLWPIAHALVRAAAARKLNLVASLSDDAIRIRPDGKGTMDRLLNDLELARHRIQQNGSWMAIVPADIMEADRIRMDRIAMRDLIRRYLAVTRLSLADKVAFSLRLPDSTDNNAAYLHVAMASGGFDSWDMPLLRIYGALAPAQRNVSIPVAKLQGRSRSLALDYLTQADELQILGIPSDRRLTPAEENSLMRPVTEPTDRLANGIPPGLILRLTESTEPSVMMIRGSEPEQPSNIEMLAMRLIGTFVSPNDPAPTHVRPATQRTVDLKLFVDAIYGVGSSMTLDENLGAIVSVDNLPEPHRTALEAIKKRIKSSPRNP